jgi:2'-5' RNA ligase
MTTNTIISTEPGALPPVGKRHRQRLFFALWPTPALAERLAALAETCQASCGGRTMRRETLHLTLAFIGELEEARLPALRAAVAALFAADRAASAQPALPPAFTLHLDQLGYWPHNHILWTGCSAPGAAVMALAAALAAALQAAGFALEARAFLPHVTLLRNAQTAALPAMPLLPWPAHEVLLVRSDLSAGHAAYEVIDRWALLPP